LLPQHHTASRTAQLSQPPERVWATITDVIDFPKWRKDVAKVELIASSDSQHVWRETSAHESGITYSAEIWDPPKHLVTRIADKDLPFGGSWDYSIIPSGSGSTITITENGEVYNPIFRLMSRIMGNAATIDSYLSALKTRLGSG
jgi:uncharacterized protein YndB with AHSA1/START domain